MKRSIQLRLARVAKNIILLNRLASVFEDSFIRKLFERSKTGIAAARAKLFAAFDEAGKKNLMALRVIEQLESMLDAFIASDGTVHKEKLPAPLRGDKLRFMRTEIENGDALYQAYTYLLIAGAHAAKLQNEESAMLAQHHEQIRELYLKAQDQMVEALHQMTAALSRVGQTTKAPEKQPEAKQPAAPVETKPAEEQKPDLALDAVKNQVDEVAADMTATVSDLTKSLLRKARIVDADLGAAYVECLRHVFSVKGDNFKVNPQLNRDKDFFEDALHMALGSNEPDLGEFVHSKSKKTLYQAYRSLLMVGRALGVIQFAQERPDLVLKSKTARELIVKAQQIAKKRMALTRSKLSILSDTPRGTWHDEDEDNDVAFG